MSDSRPVVTLLTDFGTSVPYAAMMKGVILGAAPGVNIIDLTHAVPAQQVLPAAVMLFDAYRYFPVGTIHLAVVDPGVGTSRAILAACADRHFFVAPDNGLLGPVLQAASAADVVCLQGAGRCSSGISSTFHGRDVMAPAVAALAAGEPLSSLGEEFDDWQPMEIPRPGLEPGRITGEILYIDDFGNLVSNITARDLEAGSIDCAAASVYVDGNVVRGIVRTYADTGPGGFCALLNSSGRLEVAVTNGSAARILGVEPGIQITVVV